MENSCSKCSFLRFKNQIMERVTFAWRYLKDPQAVGTPFPCSIYVAEKILQYIPPDSKKTKFHYLEIGPGTGVFTEAFINKLQPNDQLDLVEIDEGFYKVLKEKFSHLPAVKIHHKAIEEWNPPYQYDAIVSAVPLNALPSEQALEAIFSAYTRLIKKNGILSSVEYVGTSTLKKTLLWGEKGKQFNELLKLKAKFFQRYGLQQLIVWRNVPPARITYYQLGEKNGKI